MQSKWHAGVRYFNAGQYQQAIDSWSIHRDNAQARGDVVDVQAIQCLMVLTVALQTQSHENDLENAERFYNDAMTVLNALSFENRVIHDINLDQLKLEVWNVLHDQGVKPQLPTTSSARDVLSHGWRATITGQREHGWFSGLLETLEPLDALTASRSILTNGSTIAAHVHHLWFCMGVINRRLESNPESTDWNEEWAIREIDDEAWLRLKANLRGEFDRTVRWLELSAEGDAAQFNLVMEGIAHAAYHVGAVRQILVNLH